MAELGAEGLTLHHDIGTYAIGRCDLFVAIGVLAAEAAQVFGPSSLAFADIESACAALEPHLKPGVTVLIKASRVMQLDRLVKLLAASS
jgi:UDP-N-acetylmuramoyl-tripeptide--D-alanyl-D-alanine ligase